jgi:1,4-alpha-glucan branching enzyme
MLDKMPGDTWQKAANLRLLYGFMYGHPGKKLLFMGGEFGQWSEWSEARSLDWHLLQYAPHEGLMRFVADVNRAYREQPALHQVDFDWRGFDWLVPNDSDNSVFVFLRRGHNPDDVVVVACNFTPVPRLDYRVGVPRGGRWVELLNSDSALYGGSNVGNGGEVWATEGQWGNQPCTTSLTLPPLGVVYLKPA